MRKAIAKWVTLPSYILILVAVVLVYVPTREIMIAQTAWIRIIKSDLTLNVFLLLFMWGLLIDKLTKKMSRRKGWIIWGVGTILLILFFRFVGGFETIFDIAW